MKMNCNYHQQPPAESTPLEYFTDLFKQTSSDLSAMKRKAEQRINELLTITNACQDVGALKESVKHVQAAVTLLKQ